LAAFEVRRDRSSPVKKNAQIFLVSCSHLRRAPQTTTYLKSKQTTPATG